MTNERYKILCALDKAAERELGSGSLYLLSPSTRGKSDTIEIFLKNHAQAKTIRAGTNTFVYELVDRAIKNGIHTFFIDDRTRWVRNDFNDAIATIKMLGEGKHAHLRGTKFSMEEDEVSVIAIGVLSLNYLQADSVYGRLQETGFIDRALKLRVNHTDAEYQRILKEYRAHGYNNKNLPKFKLDESTFFKPFGDNSIDPQVEAWINDNFKSAIRKTVLLIAQVTTKEGFQSLIPILEKSLQDGEFKEYIEFEEPVKPLMALPEAPRVQP
jgi:MoaA/NifB/PqqE/SkfB family radical SAM enzyme